MTSPRNTRLLEKLREQLGFISRSCSAYDSGAEEEALRIATALRVLFHDTQRSTSLMRQLGLAGVQMLSSARGHGDWQDYLSINLNVSTAHPVTMRPILGDKFCPQPLETWWRKEPVFVHAGEKYTRQLIVKSAANKDGGAHVDRQLDHYYEVLQQGRYGLGFKGDFSFVGSPLFEQGVTHYARNGHLALLRQFAHETLVSAQHFTWC